MRALLYGPAPSSETTKNLQVVDLPKPQFENEAVIRVSMAGICNTDIEIVKGYMEFTGVLGHEFVGTVETSPYPEWIGKRVVGEINAGCGECALCRAGDPRHCTRRSTLGIYGRDGAFAQYLSLPLANLVEVPESISDEAAVFVEPLAAACEIVEQIDVRDKKTLIIGDGKLAQLIARVLPLYGADCLVLGRHPLKLKKLSGICQTILPSDFVSGKGYDLVVEASGNPAGLPLAIDCTRPKGAIILKSTYTGNFEFNPSGIVIDEIQLLGSRCGRFEPAIDLLRKKRIDPIPLITHRFPLEQAKIAFREAQKPEAIKILLEMP